MATPERDAIIIALDFGTTYSGVAYAYTTDPNDIRIINDWPGADRKLPKAPTVIKYYKDSQTFKWGHEIDTTLDDKISSLKLLLDPDQRSLRPYDVPINLETETAKLPKPVVEVAADYIGAIYKHALEEIKNDGMDESFLDGFEKRFVLTVPAIWSEKAKDLTKQAASRAGITPIDMITEPEAAALFTLDSMKYRGLKQGDVITVCDAGGGTVDLISYEVKGLKPLELRSLTVASGGIAGSLNLNTGFEVLVRNAVAGDDVFRVLKKSEPYRDAMNQFDSTIKPGFRGPDDPCRYVKFTMARLEDNPAKGLNRDALALPGPTLKRIFDPVISRIDELVTNQVQGALAEHRIQDQDSTVKKNTATAIFLVGGFGASQYLRSVIEKSHPGVKVVQPKDGWSAIAKGAVLSKLSGRATVLTTRASKHYGTLVHSPWTEAIDKGFPAFRSEWDEVERCKRMNWFIYKRQELHRDQKLRLVLTPNFGNEDFVRGNLMSWSTLYQYLEDEAPDHPPSNVSEGKLCTLATDLSLVPKALFIQRERPSDKATYWDIRVNLQIEINPSGLMRFSLEVGGEEYSAVEAKF